MKSKCGGVQMKGRLKMEFHRCGSPWFYVWPIELWFGCCHREQVVQMRSLCSGVVIWDRRFRWGFCGLVLSSWTGGSDEVLLSLTNFACSLAQFVVRSPASHRQLSLCSVIHCCLTFGFLRECKSLGDVSVVWTRPAVWVIASRVWA